MKLSVFRLSKKTSAESNRNKHTDDSSLSRPAFSLAF